MVFIIATVFVLVYNPLNPPPSWSRQLYTTLLVGSGFVVLFLSRVVMHLVHKHHVLYLWQYMLWGVGEVLLFIFGLTLFAYLLGDGETFSSLLLRVSLDVVGILFVPYVITVLLFLLDEKKEEIARLKGVIETQSQTIDTRSTTFNFYDRGGRLALVIRSNDVLYIESADNYCNIHYVIDGKEETFVLHNSMKYFDSWGEESGLLRCHRSYIVNKRNVKLLRKEKDTLTLELAQDGGAVPVSRSYRPSVLQAFTPTP
ncbi:MAG: LytTR family transcriptional regulator [Bacteroidales bacterium]|nr:LytTR family transcriptional regulator [Bacteroidales bacterium]